jgi:hypothetical protein
MKRKQALSLILVAVVMVVVLMLPIPAIAAGNQSNQGMRRSAMLVAPDLKTKISVYPEPTTKKRRVGFGKSGDRVTVVEQVGSNDGYTWNRVQFEASPDSEGWVRGDFVALQDRPSPQSGSQQAGIQQAGKYQQRDRYLGKQQQPDQQGKGQTDRWQHQRN